MLDLSALIRFIFLPALFLIVSFYRLEAQLPDDFYDQVVTDEFNFPVGMVFDGQGRMFVWEKEGIVSIIDSTGERLPEPLIDISEEVTNWKDQGLMGFALDQEFLENGNFYLYYAVDLHHYWYFGTPAYHPDSTVTFQPTFGRITRYTADPATNFSTVLAGSRHIVFGEDIGNGVPILFEFHGVGCLNIGTDGSLLFSCGDGTSNAGTDIGGDSLGTMITRALEYGIITPDQDIGSYKSQYLGAYNGKVLRIDSETGDGLSSNPFYDPENPRSPQSRTWALGFRNPYRFIVRPETGSHYTDDGAPGTLYIGDVGNGSWEELDVVTEGGMNFCWPIWEGNNLNWAFYINDAPANQMAPNPLYGIGGCDREFFNFRELFTWPKPVDPLFTPNPCDPSQPIPENYFPMTGKLPILAWNNSRWNPPTRAEVGLFDEEDNVVQYNIGTPESGIEGDIFDGYSSLTGAFYTGDQFPEQYRGVLFGIDYSGWIKTFRFDDQDRLLSVQPFHNNAKDIIHLALNPVEGSLYYINIQGEIRKITYGGNPPPVAVITVDKQFGPGPLEVQLDAGNSFDNTSIVAWFWDFGDGTTSDIINPVHTFSSNTFSPKTFTVKLTVTDEEGETGVVEKLISINNTPPEVDIISFKNGDLYPLNLTTSLELIANVTDQEHPDESLTYEWRTFLQHNTHFHPEPPDYAHKTHTFISPLGCVDQTYWYRIELTVTDPEGLSTTQSQEIFPNCGDPITAIELIAKNIDKKIQLSWTTEFEDSLEVFEIQRSTDFFNFETIGVAVPAGITLTETSYRFDDLTPNRGNNIYRIKAISQQRAYYYSNIATISYPPVSNIRVFPNPASDFFKVDIKKTEAGMVYFELFNLSGSKILSTNWEAETGKTFQKIILTNLMPNGYYLYRVKNGAADQAGRLLIAK